MVYCFVYNREEKVIRREKKAKEKARRLASKKKRCNNNMKLDSKTSPVNNSRFHWHCVPWYFYSIEKDAWSDGKLHHETSNEHDVKAPQAKVVSENSQLIVATWNVLFDLYDDGIETETRNGNNTAANGSLSQHRWELLCSILEKANADLISLQEVTPSFVHILCECDWVRQNYASSACPTSLESVTPSGGKKESRIFHDFESLFVVF
jgi:hypothetical protein